MSRRREVYEEPSEQRPYKSLYGGGYVSAGQFLAERMCARKARKEGIELPQRFWVGDEFWERKLVLENIQVSSLLKLYEVEAIVNALKSKDGGWICSFTMKKHLDPLIRREQKKLEDRRKAEEAKKQIEGPSEPKAPAAVAEKPRPAFVDKKSVWEKLS